ncbi:MAG: PIN domain-containing protein [Jatrophihabitans sp.]
MTRYYIDSSVAVHVLNRTRPAAAWFDSLTARSDDHLVSSRLLRTELTRVLRRDGLPITDRGIVLDKTDITPITEGILLAAEAIADHVKTLDAIHLASAMAFGPDTVVVTHDAVLKTTVEAVGLRWIDPVGDGG